MREKNSVNSTNVIRIMIMALLVINFRIVFFSGITQWWIHFAGYMVLMVASLFASKMNRWFRIQKSVVLCEVAFLVVTALLAMTPYLENEVFNIGAVVINSIVDIIILVLFVKGTIEAGITEEIVSGIKGFGKCSIGSVSLSIIIVYGFAAIGESAVLGWIALAVIAVCYIFLIYSLNGIAKCLMIQSYIVPVSKGILYVQSAIISVILFAALFGGGSFLIHHYNEEGLYIVSKQESSETDKVETIREELIAAGMEEKIVTDLLDEEVLNYEGVLRVDTQSETKKIDGASLTMYTIACKLPGSNGKEYRILNYYKWDGAPKHTFTDMMMLNMVDYLVLNEEYLQSVDGICMYDVEEGQPTETIYHKIIEQKDMNEETLLNSREVRSIFVKLPEGGYNYRGYFAVQGKIYEEDVWAQTNDYYHRDNWFNVPYKKPSEYFMQDPIEGSNYFNFYSMILLDEREE